MSDNILELKHITKLYPGVVALNDVSLEVRRGEILALVGENGAGKSTLIKTCSGAITPTQGEIVINGKSFTGMTPQTSEQNGIGVIYQEFNLVGDLSVAENIFLGRAIRKGMVIDLKAMERESKKILDSLNIKINPKTLVNFCVSDYFCRICIHYLWRCSNFTYARVFPETWSGICRTYSGSGNCYGCYFCNWYIYSE